MESLPLYNRYAPLDGLEEDSFYFDNTDFYNHMINKIDCNNNDDYNCNSSNNKDSPLTYFLKDMRQNNVQNNKFIYDLDKHYENDDDKICIDFYST